MSWQGGQAGEWDHVLEAENQWANLLVLALPLAFCATFGQVTPILCASVSPIHAVGVMLLPSTVHHTESG